MDVHLLPGEQLGRGDNHTHKHTDAHTQMHAHAHKHTHMTCTHRCTHTHANTHTHTHYNSPPIATYCPVLALPCVFCCASEETAEEGPPDGAAVLGGGKPHPLPATQCQQLPLHVQSREHVPLMDIVLTTPSLQPARRKMIILRILAYRKCG